MKQYPLLENKIAKGLFALYLMLMLFLSRDTLFSSCIVGFERSQLYMIALIGALGICFLVKNRKDLKSVLLDRRMIAFAISAAVLLVPMVLKQDWQMMYFSILLCLLFAVFLTYFTTYREISKWYVLIMTFLGVYSIIASYWLRSLATAGQINPSSFFNSSGWKFYDFIFGYAVSYIYWIRNFGIFREPGVYQFFILLAVFLNNYAADWKKEWQMWTCNVLLALTMVTTFAVGGFAELGLFVLLLYFDKKYYRKTWGKIAGFVAVVGVGAFLAYFLYRLKREDFGNTILYEFYDMFIRLFTKSDSATDRMDAITTNIQFFIRNPLAGDTIANVLHGTNHNTSSTLLLFAVLGVAGGVLNAAAWVALAWEKKRGVFGNLVLLLVLFMSFNTQNLTANVFFWLFPMMALVERGLPVLKLSSKKE